MRIACQLREIRGERSLRELAEASGISAGVLSMVERGHTIPLDGQVPAIEEAYGRPWPEWYDRELWPFLEPDVVAS